MTKCTFIIPFIVKLLFFFFSFFKYNRKNILKLKNIYKRIQN